MIIQLGRGKNSKIEERVSTGAAEDDGDIRQ